LIFDLHFGGNPTPLTGEVTYNDMVRTVFGVPVNLGSAGTLDVSGLVTTLPPLYNSGTWTTRAVGAQCASCDSACNGCSPACSLCWAMSGTFTCTTNPCDPDAPSSGATSLVSTVSLTGSIVAGLPPGLAYTIDGGGVTRTGNDGDVYHYRLDPFVLNAFPTGGTNPGGDQTVSVDTTFLNPKTNEETPVEIDVTFTNVNSPGTTTIVAFSESKTPAEHITVDIGHCSKTKRLGCSSDDDCPDGQTCGAYHGFFFDVSTTASVSGPITVCSHYKDAELRPKGGNGIVDGTGKPGVPEGSLRLFHSEGGAFVDVTLPGYPDKLNNVVCGRVTSLSEFGVAVKKDLPGGGTNQSSTTDCITEWSPCYPEKGGKVKPATNRNPVPKAEMTCTAGKGVCKDLLAPNTCKFCFRICPNVTDSRLPACVPKDVFNYVLVKPALFPASDDSIVANRVIDALRDLSPSSTYSGTQVIFADPPLAGVQCTSNVEVTVPKGFTKKISLTAVPSSGGSDQNELRLICK
jgi:hypothetical protein